MRVSDDLSAIEYGTSQVERSIRTTKVTPPTVRVFVSSTWRDLISERKAVESAAQRMSETRFAGMEYVGSRDKTTRRTSLDEVDRSDIYVGILGARYGSGITEAEYRRARERGLHCLIYFKAKAAITLDKTENDPAQIALLNKLKDELRQEHTVVEFSSPEDLATKVTGDLYRLISDEFSSKAPATEATTSTASARYQLRAPVGDFVGREKEIDTLTGALRTGGAAGISGISGMGGIGKTELALYVADRLRGAYPDAQLFVDMRGTDERPRDPADAIADCVRAFVGPEQRLPESLDDLMRLYRSALSDKRVLVLLDNASDAAQVRPLLPPASSALLVTSREAIRLPGMKRLTLEQLPPTEARELLTGIAPRVPPDIADRICYLCGYLPLAVRAAGSLLDINADLSPTTYADQLHDERTRLARIGTEGVDLNVEASLGLSYQRLPPDVARVFRQLSVFPASFDAAAEESICEDPDHNHLSALVRRNLVIYNAGAGRYRLHDLARLFAAARMGDAERGASQRHHAEHYLRALREMHRLYVRGGEALMRGLALFDIEWRNIQAGQSWAEQQAGEDDAAASLCSDYPSAGTYLLDLRQHPREQIRWLEAALAASRRLKRRGAEGTHLGNLGNAYASLGETRRAIEYHEQALAIDQESGDRLGEGQALGNLGFAYAELGESRRAIEYHEQYLAIAREIGDRRGEGQALGNLGNAYASLGETRRAIGYHEQYLAIAREIGDRRGEGQALGNLGFAYAELGESRRAIEFCETSLNIFREIGDLRNEGLLLITLGRIYERMDEMSRAVEFYERTLEVSRSTADSKRERLVLNLLGAAYHYLKQPGRAISYYQRALDLARQAKQTSTIADILFSMGNLALDSNEPDQARRFLSESRKLYQQLKSPVTAVVDSLLSELEAFGGGLNQLIETAKKFLGGAGIKLVLIPGTQVYRCEFSTNDFRRLLPGPVFACILQGKELDDIEALSIYDQIKKIEEVTADVFVVTDSRPTDVGWGQIGILRGRKKPCVIIPIDSVLLNEGLTNKNERNLLRTEIEKRKGGRYNPYNQREPVAGAFSFFGRGPLVESLLQRIDGGQPVGVFGLRKLGKSSVLRALKSRATFPVAMINLQTLGDEPLEHLFSRIAKYWKDWLRVHYELKWDPPSFSGRGATGRFIDAVLELLDQMSGKRESARLGLLLDEIEVIVPRPDGRGPDLKRYLTLLRALRGLIDEDGRLSLVVAGLNPSVNRINSWGGEQNPTFNLFQEYYLPPLTADDCMKMASNIGRQVELKYELESLQAISELSGGHPFLARQLCGVLYERRDCKGGVVRFPEIAPCVDYFILNEETVTHVDAGIWRDAGNEALWSEAGGRINQSLLLDLARAGESLPREELLGGVNRNARLNALINLERIHIVYNPTPDTCAIKFGLLQEWLRRRKLGME
jgi:tetratricopeptide (TPR) repeat protein